MSPRQYLVIEILLFAPKDSGRDSTPPMRTDVEWRFVLPIVQRDFGKLT